MTISLVDFTGGHVADVPSMMEACAEDIRKMSGVNVGAAVFLDDDGKIIVAGWGRDASDVATVGLLHMGAAWLSAQKVTR